METKLKSTSAVSDVYLELILNVHPLRPIRSRQEHQRAKTALRSLASDRRKAATDFKIVLATLIEAYERDARLQLDVSEALPADIVRHLLAERKLSANGFAQAAGISQSALSDMLNGKRDWSKSAIRAVTEFFSISPAIFFPKKV